MAHQGSVPFLILYQHCGLYRSGYFPPLLIHCDSYKTTEEPPDKGRNQAVVARSG